MAARAGYEVHRKHMMCKGMHGYGWVARMSQRKIWLLLFLLAAQWDSAAAEEPITLRVMTLNVWYGGEQVSLPKIVRALHAEQGEIYGQP